MKIYKKISRKKWKTPLLLLLLLLAVVGSAKAQVLINGVIYEKLDIFGKISGENTALLYDGEYNGPYTSTRSNNGDYSYVNVILDKPLKGQVIVKFDTYSDHLPIDIDFYAGENGNPVVESLGHIARTSPDAPYMVTLSIPEDGNYDSIQMRAHSEEGNEFCLREMEVLAEVVIEENSFATYNLNNKLGSNNQTNNFTNLIDRDITSEWGINWQLNGVVEGEYSSIKVDLGYEYEGYVHVKYINGVRQSPVRVSFYGYNGEDWNSKDAETPNINTRWEEVEYKYIDNDLLKDFLNDPSKIDEWEKGLYQFANGDQEPWKTRNVILNIEKPYRYIMMRVYDTSGNPGSGYNGHIAGNNVTDQVEGIGYVSNFDLNDFKVERWVTEELYEKYGIAKFANLGFTHTHGALSSLNDEAWGYDNAPINEDNNWTDPSADRIAQQYGVEFPDFNYVGETKTLQATHEREYDVYVIPGHTVALIPYSDMHQTAAYGDGYVRWYNYKTDKAVEDKYFGYHVNPGYTWQIPPGTKSPTTESEVGGMLGGVDLLRLLSEKLEIGGAVAGNDPMRGCFAQFHVNADDNDSFDGYTVAADFSMSWGDNGTLGSKDRNARANGMWVESENGEKYSVLEPAVNCRSIFHIHDGRKFAEELSASAENNKKFIESRRRILSAAPDKSFYIRLDFKEPAGDGYHSNVYYKKSDNEYGRVSRFKVVAYDKNGNQINDAFIINNGKTAEGNDVTIPQLGYITEEAYKEFNRFLHCEKEIAKGGETYTVRIYGLDEDDNEIEIINGGGPLQIMEYVITFENNPNVSMIEMADYLKNLDNKGKLKENADPQYRPNHTYQSLEQRFGESYCKQTYDQYLALANALKPLGRINDYFITNDKPDGGKYYVRKMGLNFRYPIMWERGDYTFPYTVEEGWNHYSISNHSEMTSFSAGAGRHNYRGLHDVSFYMKHPLLYGKKDETVKETNFDYNTHDFSDAGFFFYADAASDPGTVARVMVNKSCPGTRIHVSAWVSEFGVSNNGDANNNAAIEDGNANYSDGNWCNVIFNFRAKNTITGEQKTIYTYVPGKVPDFGFWYHIYFSFIPEISSELLNSEDWEYYISLESNAPSSLGADFAVDDIRIYLEKPDVNLIQLAPICNPEEEEDVRVLVECPFDMVLSSSGIKPDDDPEFYFCVIDKEKYEETKDLKSSMISLKNHGEESSQLFGKLSFSPSYDKLEEYSNKETKNPVGMKAENIYNEKCMYFFFTVSLKDVYVGQELIFCAHVEPNDENGDNLKEDDLHYLFDVESECSIHSGLRLRGATIIKLDGVAVADRENIVCCENQRPVVQLTMVAKPDKGQDIYENYRPEDGNLLDEEYTKEIPDAYYDWYDGEYLEFLKVALPDESPETHNLEMALSRFRQDYPLAETFEMPTGENYQRNDSILIARECNAGRLHLRRSFYIFPEYHLGDKPEIKVYVTAIPIFEEDQENENELLCLSPVEVPLTIRNQAPVMLHGFGIDYPEQMMDVPLRAGLRQIRKAQGANATTLWMPVRKVQPVTQDVATLVKPEDKDAAYLRMPDQYVYLVGSNDPRYQSLNPDDYDPEKDVFGEFSGLMEVGELRDILADKNRAGANFVGMKFKDDFQPREGYYYVLRYSFVENPKEVGNRYEGMEDQPPCYGEDVLTIKIVPEYQMWVGKDGDYNNDSNWRRVSANELLAAGNNGLNDFVTDATVVVDGETHPVNSNMASYVPMDFTKVIVPDLSPVADDDDELSVIDLKNLDGEVAIEFTPYGEDAQPIAQKWTGDKYDGDIKYDMAAYLDNNENIQCKLWYHNTCEQIHFNFGSEMLRQGELRYEKAWLDLDNKPGSWYFLSLPLKDVYAGEFYLPSADAVDKSQLFTPITYDTDLHDRFRPAVYQRGWNKGQATIYRPDGTTDNAAAKTTTEWSRVYNDVLERYDMDSNPGFSVRTDLTFMNGDTENIDKVRFRLPKADARWSYRDMEGGTDGYRGEIPNINGSIVNNAQGNPERVVGDDFPYHKLNDSFGLMNASVARDSEYFLVGNPFICHLDLEKFFEINSTDIESQCWILNDGQLISIVPEMYADEAGKAWRYLPPFQGFFVKKKGGAAKELEVSFTEGMMASMMTDNIMTLGTRPVVATDNSLLITMSAPGESDSHIRIMLGEGDADAPALFNADSENGMTAYSVSDGLATSVKYVDEIKKEEVGVSVKGEKEVKIRFNGGCLDGLMLHDNLTGEVIELYDGMEYTVNGTASGRLYITSGIEEPAIVVEDFRVEVSEGKVAVIAPGEVETLLLQVFDTEGHLISNSLSDSNRAEAELEPGIYILKAVTDAGSNFTAKVRL